MPFVILECDDHDSLRRLCTPEKEVMDIRC